MISIEEKRRELFEEWFENSYGIVGIYPASTVSMCWWAFNAAIDAVVIELPPEDTNGRITWTSAMRAIESAGLKVEP